MKYTNSGIPVVEGKFIERYVRKLSGGVGELVKNCSEYTIDRNLTVYTLELAVAAGKINPLGGNSEVSFSSKGILIGKRVIEGVLRKFVESEGEGHPYELPRVSANARTEAHKSLNSNREAFFTIISNENSKLARMLIEVASDVTGKDKDTNKIAKGRIIAGGCIAYNLFDFQSRLNGGYDLENVLVSS